MMSASPFLCTFLVVSALVFAATQGQQFRCTNRLGLQPDPNNCANFYNCGHGSRAISQPCGDGTLFDERVGGCRSASTVTCNSRPLTGSTRTSTSYQSSSRNNNAFSYRQELPLQRTALSTQQSRIYIEFYTPGRTGSQAQCTSIGSQLTSYLRNLVQNYDSTCQGSSDCQDSLPIFITTCSSSSNYPTYTSSSYTPSTSTNSYYNSRTNTNRNYNSNPNYSTRTNTNRNYNSYPNYNSRTNYNSNYNYRTRGAY